MIKTPTQIPLPPITLADLKAVAGDQPCTPMPQTPISVTNNDADTRTGWLYLDKDETSPLGRKHRDSLTDRELGPDEREALKLLGDAIDFGRSTYLDMDTLVSTPDGAAALIAQDSMPLNRDRTKRPISEAGLGHRPEVCREELRRRIVRVAGSASQHGASTDLMQSLSRRLGNRGGPSGT
ncbi:hypothetical protein [Pinirhizobacter soli]|uniref:hypothetical protein n=1 Tax=Pinirhizobacter soli TaxID=2786953 RepID=UPI00202A3570|nr:hypothetical protein [Pinirhizobacter soli]